MRFDIRRILILPTLLGLAVQICAQSGADYKVPDGYLKAPFAGTGVVMLDPKKPAGMFVVYLDGQTPDKLRTTLLETLAKMFIHQEKNLELKWILRELPLDPTDGKGVAQMHYAAVGDKHIQVAVYERSVGPRPFLYGYFAMRQPMDKGESAKFLDDEGRGIKDFDKLRKSFSK